MRKTAIKISAACLIGALSVYVITLVSAASKVDVVMTIALLDIELPGNNLNVPVSQGDDIVRDRIVVRNIGSVTSDFALKVTSSSGASWNLVSSNPGVNEYRLSAIWHQWNTLFSTNTGEFQSNDILTGSDQTSTDTLFFNDSEPADHATSFVKGFDVGINGERNLFVHVEGPSDGTGPFTAHLGITVLATP